MKKFITLILTAFMTVSAFAQVSVTTGYTNNSRRASNDYYTNSAPLNGFYVGGDVNVNIIKEFGVDVGLQYQFLAGQYTDKELYKVVTSKTTEHYLALPIMANYGYRFTPDVKLFVFVGPTFQVGLAAVAKNYVADIYTQDVDLYKDTDQNRFNVFLGGGIGADFWNNFRVTVAYDWGLVSKFKNQKAYDRALSVGVAVMF